MKKLEKIILLTIAFLLLSSLLSTNNIYRLIADGFLLTSGLSFFFYNVFKGIDLLKTGRITTYLKNTLPLFVASYLISVTLYVIYIQAIGENGINFKLEYLFAAYGNQESVPLILFYLGGLFYGYLRTNRKAVYYTLGSLGLIAVLAFSFIALTQLDKSDIKSEKVFFIEDEFNTVQEIAALPQFENKIVYIDLWFSSCSPCIKQFKEGLPELKNELKEHNVEYLYLARETSHVDSETRWLEAIEKYNLNGWHYYFPKKDEKLIWNSITENIELEFTGYPHYLISVNGEIIDYNAPDPMNSEEIVSVLNKLSTLN